MRIGPFADNTFFLLLTLMLLVANLANTKWCENLKSDWKPSKRVLIWEWSARATHSNEYQHARNLMVFKSRCVLMLWTTVAPALEGLGLWWFLSDVLFPGGSKRQNQSGLQRLTLRETPSHQLRTMVQVLTAGKKIAVYGKHGKR